VHCSDALPAVSLGVVEGIARDPFRSIPSDQLDRLNDTVDDLQRRLGILYTSGEPTGTDLVLNARVLSFCVFADENGVDIIIWCLVSGDGYTWPDVGEKVESPSEGQIKGNVTLSDCPATISEQAKTTTEGTYSVWPKVL